MSLSPGTRLGPYEIVASLGRGGMGEVYRARDTRLNRLVALKVPDLLALDPERRERFEREARAVAALNHPNIVTVHSVEHIDGIALLTMELVDGRSLADAIPREGLPGRLLEIAIAVADAVAAAHQKGITHRDLKPANIMLGEGEQQGRVKVLDFGLAKLTDVSHDSAIATMPTAPVTGEGRILGTVAYMSPEQAEGKAADARSDIFSLGVILYEMTTGRRPFTGDTAISIISSIVKDTPASITELNPALPPDLGRIVRRALVKDPERRYQTAKDLRNDLEELKASIDSGELAAPVRGAPAGTGHTPDRRRLWIASAAIAIVLVSVVAAVMLQSPSTPAPVARLAIALPNEVTADPGRLLGAPAISPDGTTVAMTMGHGSDTYLALRRLDADRFQRLAGTERAVQPFWSPDNRHVGFFADRDLKRVAVAGGQPQTLCTVGDEIRGGAWGPTGTILIGTNYGNDVGVLRVSDQGGRPVPVTTLDASLGENSHRFPVWLPDGNQFVYFARTKVDANRGIYLDSLDRKKPRKKLVVTDSYVAVAADPATSRTYLLYSKDDNLWAQSFDTDRGVLSGDPVQISEAVGQFSTSATGTLVSRQTLDEQTQLTWFDRGGKNLGTVGGAPADYWGVQLSPDNARVAVVLHRALSGYFAIWLIDPARNVSTPFSLQTERSSYPVWTPDSKRLYFSSASRQQQLFSKAVDDTGAEQVLSSPGKTIVPRDVSPDGTSLLADLRQNNDLVRKLVYSTPGKDDWRPLVGAGSREEFGQFSPSGKWIAYQSNETGAPEIWLTDFPRGKQKHRLSEKGGQEPRWRRDGRELFYISSDHNVMTVAIGPEGRPEPSKMLFRAVLPLSDGWHYAVSADAQKFLVQVGRADQSRTLNVVFNWPQILRTAAR